MTRAEFIAAARAEIEREGIHVAISDDELWEALISPLRSTLERLTDTAVDATDVTAPPVPFSLSSPPRRCGSRSVMLPRGSSASRADSARCWRCWRSTPAGWIVAMVIVGSAGG